MSNLSEREEFIILVDNEQVLAADAAVLLQGDGLYRARKAAELVRAGWAPCVVVSGGAQDVTYGSLPGLPEELVKLGVEERAIVREDQSRNTKEQAEETMKLVKVNGWARILLVASHYHQYRAFLTFLQAMKQMGLRIEIINTPARDLPWFTENPWGRRADLLKSEFEKIERYQKEGDVATFREAIEYQQWKQKQST